MKYCRYIITFAFLFSCYTLNLRAATSEEIMSKVFCEGVTIDLREPVYSDGALSTTKGGVIVGPNMRIQARRITYIRKLSDGEPIFTAVAEGDLMLEYNGYIFVGDRMEYDFQNKIGKIFNGRTAMEPWFFGGQEIDLLADGSYLIRNGFITTSENYKTEWEISAGEARITDDKYLRAKNVQFRFVNLPVFWVPSFKADLDSIFDAPLKYRVRWGGSQGPRFGAIYEAISWRNFKAFLRLDYRVTRGLGGGLETDYHNDDRSEFFLTCNYLAQDSSIEDPSERWRFRFQGKYGRSLYDDRLKVDLTYDKVSDNQMETDYYEKGLELKTAQRTQLLVRHQYDDLAITNFTSCVRLNYFQTVKQELPTLSTSFHPIEIGSTGIITENLLEVSYLDFKYTNNLPNVSNYSSSRLEYRNRFYRPFSTGPINHLPQVGFVGINYGNSSSADSPSNWLAMGTVGYGLNTQVSRTFGDVMKHTIEPYVSYDYYTFPSISPDEHFIFDINDGWFRLNKLTYGCRNLIYVKRCDEYISRYLLLDLYANTFFDTPTMDQSTPYIYGRLVWDIFSSLRFTLTDAWDLERQEIGYYNFRSDLTINEDFAVAAEYRHRNAFAWRKADETNFILESFHTESELLASQLSDRRDTVLLHAFYRFKPNWAIEFISRHGWNRTDEPAYNEYEIDLLTTLGTAWHFKISYQHQEDDDRIAFYVNVGLKRPECRDLHCE